MRNKTYTHLLLAIVSIVTLSSGCNNYGLLENMENPAGVLGSRVFVSSLRTAGDLSGFASSGCAGNGVGKAVCVCKYLANKAGLKNADKFAPWLSESGIAPRCVLQGIGSNTCSGTPRGSWYNLKKEPVVLSGSALLGGAFVNPVRYTETGEDAGTALVYTGTGTDGNTLGGNCTNWTVTNLTATVGSGHRSDVGWTASDTAATCGTLAGIYCFEVQ